MADWQSVLQSWRAASQPPQAVLVTVIEIKGSAPREVGARMWVTPDACYDTIGGGQLEWQAIHHARQALAEQAWLATVVKTWQTEISLGADCQQCCGGKVKLHFECLPSQISSTWQPAWPAAGTQAGAGVRDFNIAVFGAGHVGLAVVKILALLPCQVDWIDSRAQYLTRFAAPRIRPILQAIPPAYIADLPADCYFLIMTHDHTLDLELCDHILAREDFAFLGMIGSKTKAARFKQRLRQRGVVETQLQRLVCPVGLTSIQSKHPAAIAVAVVAQLLQVHHQHSTH